MRKLLSTKSLGVSGASVAGNVALIPAYICPHHKNTRHRPPFTLSFPNTPLCALKSALWLAVKLLDS